MNPITRDVVTDLLPAYLSGEASADTRTLVEEFFRGDPDFARTVRDATGAILRGGTISPSPGLELRALDRTKRLLRARTILFAFALTFSLLPLSFEVSSGAPPHFVFWHGDPTPGILFCFLAAIFWGGYAALTHRIGKRGIWNRVHER